MTPPLRGLDEFRKWSVVDYAIAGTEVNRLEWAVAMRRMSPPVLQLQLGSSPALEFGRNLVFDSPSAMPIAANNLLIWRLTDEWSFYAEGLCRAQQPFRATTKVDCKH
jgi:hypothetical protein